MRITRDHLLEVLVESRRMIATPDRWTQGGALARDTNGQRVVPYADEAVCWCASGAVMLACSKVADGAIKPGTYKHMLVSRQLCDFVHDTTFYEVRKEGGLGYWNDESSTSHEDIIAAFDKAIAATVVDNLEREKAVYKTMDQCRIINLTQHDATSYQKAAGVIELKGEHRDYVRSLLTFGTLPSVSDLVFRAADLADAAQGALHRHGVSQPYCKAMIGGAPYLMAFLERALEKRGIEPVYAFTLRESVETEGEDGKVLVKRVFKHIGFVRTCQYGGI